MSLPIKRVRLNLPQMLAVLSRQPNKDLEWGRGTGKSTIMGYFMKKFSEMPRGKFFLSGTSYRDMLGTTLPSTVEGMEKFGLVKNVHYFVGSDKGVRKGWAEPFQAPLDYVNCIHFHTGTVVQLVSQDKSSIPHRGVNWDGGLSDEHALQDDVRFYNECIAGTRTNRPLFKDNPLYRAVIKASTTPMTRAGLHFLRGEQLAVEHPDQYFFLSASARHNTSNLSPDFFDKARRESPSEMHYMAEIENVRPRLTLNGYYPALEKRHYYSALDGDFWLHGMANGITVKGTSLQDRDCDRDKPIIFSFDPGARMNAVSVQQKVGRELRTINEFFRIKPALIQEVFTEDVIPYYVHHTCKKCKLYHDRTANNAQADSRKTVAERIRDLLVKAGWQVEMCMMNSAVILQDDKYHLISAAMKEDDPRLPRVRINKDNCRNTAISLENAEAYEDGNRKIKKDKRSERRKGVLPQHATDFSDAWDLPLYHLCKAALREAGRGEFMEVSIT